MRTRRRIVVLAAALSLALAGVALAAAPKKGATYTGKTSHESQPITLKVSRTGKTVTVSEAFAPLYCEGGGAGEKQIAKAATISRSGAFSTVITYEFVQEHKVTSKLYVKGTFNGKKVKGTARSEFLLAHQCDGSTSFSAATK